MPLYEYRCKKCGHTFEKLRQFSDPKIRKCPECGGTVEQLVSASAMRFKGTGWYVTDYAKKSSAPASSSSASSDGDSSAKKDGDSGTKKKEDKPKAESKKAEKK